MFDHHDQRRISSTSAPPQIKVLCFRMFLFISESYCLTNIFITHYRSPAFFDAFAFSARAAGTELLKGEARHFFNCDTLQN